MESITLKTNSRTVIPKQILTLMFIKTASARLEEIDKLILKTECAMKLNDSNFWGRRLKNNYRDLEEVKRVNEEILVILNAKKERR